MTDTSPETESREVPLDAGFSTARAKRWGRLGAAVGIVAGVGSALIAVYLDGASWMETSLYPSIFARREFLFYDFFLLAAMLAGAGFLGLGLFHARRSPFPRTDTYGAVLTGLILTLLGSALFFLRIIAMMRVI